MSYLSEDRATEMLAKLRGTDTEMVEDKSVVETTVSPQENQDVKEVSSTHSEEGHNVPYQRFQQVISSRNKLQEEKERLALQLQQLQEKLETQHTRKDKVETYQEETSYSGEENYADEPDSRYTKLESRIQEFEVYKHEQLLERELAQVSNEFPNVPRELLLQAVIDNPSANLMEVAGQYTSYVASVEEGAIARYLKENNIAVPKRSATQGGSSGGGNTHSALNTGNTQKPKTVGEATSRFKEFLKNNPF